jgi:hypothetical protein
MIETKDPERVVVDTAVQEKAPTAIESLLDLPTRGCRTAPELSAGGQARRHHGLALHTRFSSSAPGGTEVPAHAARPRRPRPSPQDRGQPSARRPLGPATRSRVACAPSRAASARAEDPFVARPQGASAAARLGLPSLAATPVTAPKGGQFLLHAKALDDKSLRRLYNRSRHRQSRKACTGYRPRHPQRQGLSRSQLSDRFKVFISGQVRHTTKAVRREMRRRAAVEPVIGHLQGRSRMGRNYRKGRGGDSIDAILTAAGYNFSALLR